MASALGAVATWLYNWKATRFRSRLRGDLEILKLYAELHTAATTENDTRYRALEQTIGDTIDCAYGERSVNWYLIRWGVFNLALGVVNLLVEPSVLNLLVGWLGLLLGFTLVVFGLSTRRTARQ